MEVIKMARNISSWGEDWIIDNLEEEEIIINNF
jgi:hypothetical protein